MYKPYPQLSNDYEPWLNQQVPLEVGKTYTLRHSFERFNKEQNIEMTLIEKDEDQCTFTADGLLEPFVISESRAYFKIYKALYEAPESTR
jgi:hypothetical protein